VGKNNGNGSRGNICSDCESKLIPIKLYAPEILKIFSGGNKTYSKNGILTSFSTCLSPHCKTGHANLRRYERVVEEGMLKVE
jgi:hypothetical protein